MGKILDDAVTQAKDGTWSFMCPVSDGSCAPFITREWPSRKTATARGQEHFDEHTDGRPMSSLDDFRDAHGLSVNDDGKAVLTAEDLA